MYHRKALAVVDGHGLVLSALHIAVSTECNKSMDKGLDLHEGDPYKVAHELVKLLSARCHGVLHFRP